jgi:two-component system chemotaxis response regulator CheY
MERVVFPSDSETRLKGDISMKTILLVDDSTTLLMSIKAILEKAGYAVQTATGGDAALKLLAGMKPNLMITDLNMPGMDGITLIKEVKKLPACRFMPVLVMTTESQQQKRTDARAAGATGWLVKPVKPEELVQVLKKLIP